MALVIVLKGVSAMKRNTWSRIKLIGLVAVTVLLMVASPYRSIHAAPGTPTCGGLAATIVGTPGNDVLVGTSGPDVIVGGSGDDQISGLEGDDVICGDQGNDVIQGYQGNDI